MSRLNYHHLYYFWRVATEGNLTQTAQALHVSQSALSTQIRQLESVMNVRLFDREGRKLLLTDSGVRVLSYANEIFSIGDELESLLKDGFDAGMQQIRIGMLSTMSRNFIEAFIGPLLHAEGAQFSLHARGMENLLDGLVKHQFDVVLSNINVQQGGETLWHSHLLARQPLAIFGPPDQNPQSPFPQGYDALDWVLPAQNTPLRIAFDGFCTRHQFTPKVKGEADDMAMLRLLARDSGAVSVLPEVVVQDEMRQGLLINYMNLPNVYENFYAITIKRKSMPDIVNRLLAQFADEVIE